MKVDYEELMGFYKAYRYGHPGDGEYEDAAESMIDAIPDIVKEHDALQKHIREIEQQKVWLAHRLAKMFSHTVSTKEWLELAEKEAWNNDCELLEIFNTVKESKYA
jgi:hypothetical protein